MASSKRSSAAPKTEERCLRRLDQLLEVEQVEVTDNDIFLGDVMNI